MDAGHDVNNINTTIPLYLARVNEEPQLALDYEVQHYPPGEVCAILSPIRSFFTQERDILFLRGLLDRSQEVVSTRFGHRRLYRPQRAHSSSATRLRP